MVDNATLRENARMQLGESVFASMWIIMAVISFVCVVGQAVLVGVIIGVIFIGPLMYGKCRVFIGAVNGKSPELQDMSSGLTEAFW